MTPFPRTITIILAGAILLFAYWWGQKRRLNQKRDYPKWCKEFTVGFVRLSYCILLFILPLRWCYTAPAVEQANFPLNGMEWLFSTIWPQALLPIIAAWLLILTIQIHKPPEFWRDGALAVPLLTFAPLVAGLAGLVHTTEWAYAIKWFWHFYTIAMLACGLWWASRRDPRLLPWAFVTIAAGGAIAAFEGWTQHFGGLERELQMQLENARETGIELSEQMLLKFQQTRSYGHFMDPNVYAAHLLLTCPFLLLVLDRLGRRCSSPKAARILLVGAGAVLFLGALVFSGSRGAFVGLAGGLVIFGWIQWGKTLSRKATVALVVVAILGALVGGFGISVLSQRKLETASVRLEYYQTATRIFARFPVFGAGLGEFFPWHVRLKDWQLDEARDPHSMFFAQLSQCGIFGLVDALLRLGIPLLLALGFLRKYRHSDTTQVAVVLAAWCAWNIHSLLQFNDLIVSTACLAGSLGLFAFKTPSENQATVETPSNLQMKIPFRRYVLPGLTMTLMFYVGFCALLLLPQELLLQKAMNQSEKTTSTAAISPELQKAIRLAPSEIYPVRRLLDIAMYQKDYAVAKEASDELIRRAPHRSTSWLKRWQLLTLTDAPETERQAALDNAILWYPCSSNLWFQVALVKLNLPKERFLQLQGSMVHFGHREGNTVTLAYKLPKLKDAWLLDDLQNRLNQLALTTPDGFQLKFQEER
ncbi:MAG: O-antigen ligase family protein [Victivallales bacterium]|nr:O-antigen ligase family protein [Victivallales bacterium]